MTVVLLSVCVPLAVLSPPVMQRDLADFSPEHLEHIASLGYRDIRVCGDAGLCGMKRLLYTEGLVVGIDPTGYDRRYCYETTKDAEAALAVWDGVEHPSGPWVMCKGANMNLMNPELAKQA